MSNLSKEVYNEIPVSYCKRCLSLRVMNLVNSDEFDFCDECGSTDIEQTHIENWRNLYKARYGFEYINK